MYNCGGYEKLQILHLLDGIIDIYMPDFKYHIKEWGLRYSRVRDYTEHVTRALLEMDGQVGGLKLDKNGIAYRGLIIRHLMMPGGLDNTKKVLKFIKDNLSDTCLVNLMDQYYPAHEAFNYKELSKSVSTGEYREAQRYAQELGLRLAK